MENSNLKYIRLFRPTLEKRDFQTVQRINFEKKKIFFHKTKKSKTSHAINLKTLFKENLKIDY
jgi:hypothetical protein